MSIFEAELRRRLESGGDIEDVVGWFTSCLAASPAEAKNLSPFEYKFFERTQAAFVRWLRRRRN